jgi:hypothetical protein
VSPSESTPPWLATPGTFRPQGFSPSRRISPRPDARPCFMPVTPMGFRSSGVSPHYQVPQLVAPELPSWRFLLRTFVIMCGALVTRLLQVSPVQAFWPPSGPFSSSESVPPGECYLSVGGRSPPELLVASPGSYPMITGTGTLPVAAPALTHGRHSAAPGKPDASEPATVALASSDPGKPGTQASSARARFSGFTCKHGISFTKNESIPS